MRGDQQFRLHADLMRTNVPDGADVELSRARDRGGAPPRLTDVHRLGSRNVGAITNRVHVTADQNSFIPLIDQSHFDADFCQLPFRPMIDVFNLKSGSDRIGILPQADAPKLCQAGREKLSSASPLRR